MQHSEFFAESRSKDPVLREMARIADLIVNDPALKPRRRAELIRKLATEYHAYKAWNKQYASYFRTPRSQQTKKEGSL